MINFKKRKTEKLFDVVNTILILVFALLVVGNLKPFLDVKLNFDPSSKILEPLPTAWGRNRDFPPDFTEEEKIILTEQYHDYERTSEEMDKAYEHFRELLKTYRSSNPQLTIIPYKEDCFARPVILTLIEGEQLTITNSGDIKVNIGINGGQINIDPRATITVPVKFVEDEENQTIWGYSCSPKGLAGYFIKED